MGGGGGGGGAKGESGQQVTHVGLVRTTEQMQHFLHWPGHPDRNNIKFGYTQNYHFVLKYENSSFILISIKLGSEFRFF